jgi:Glycosyl transferase family 90
VEAPLNKTLRPTLNTVLKVWKYRLRTARHMRDAQPGGEASTEELAQLVSPQTAYWESRPPLSGPALTLALRDLNERFTGVFILSIRGEKVRLWDKRQFSFPADEASFRLEEQRSSLKRAMLYRAYLGAVLRRAKASDSFDLALDVNDLPQDSAELPIFAFQKQRGAKNLLLPDVDFFHSQWYAKENDSVPFEAKAHSACFVGSSTGDLHTVDSIRKLASRRLRMAAHFHGHPQVMFQIANATQCLTDEAKTYLMQQRYFSSFVSWQEQLRHRFLIVMDGNGATCSRLVKGLMSNSVVIKFNSPHELYYFPALKPERDHLLVENEQDLERIVVREAAHPGSFKAVALQGQQFAAKYLTVGSVMDYTALLLKSFAALKQRAD